MREGEVTIFVEVMMFVSHEVLVLFTTGVMVAVIVAVGMYWGLLAKSSTNEARVKSYYCGGRHSDRQGEVSHVCDGVCIPVI